MKKILVYSLVLCLAAFVCLVVSDYVESAPKKKALAISISAVRQKIQKVKDGIEALDNISRFVMVDYETRQEVKANNYDASLTDGREQLRKAESALSRAKYREALDAVNASLQGLTQARQALLDSAKWAAAKDDRIAEWQKFIAEVEIRIPEALKKSIFSDSVVNLSDNVLLTCAPPNIIYPRRACQGKWTIRKNLAGCPYLACLKGKKEVPVCASALSYVNRDPKKGPVSQQCCPGLYLTKTKNNEYMCQWTKGGVECYKDTDCPQPLCAEIPAQCILGKCASPTCSLMVMLVGPPAPTPTAPLAEESVTPPAPSFYDKCIIEGMKDHQCSNKKAISWSCECFNFNTQSVADYYYNCKLEPIIACTPVAEYLPLAITAINIRYRMSPDIQIFWDTSKPTISHMEYGETTAYGSVFQGIGSSGSADTPDKLHFLGNAGLSVGSGEGVKLRPDAIYHYRITATDANGNKIVSDDYTFSTVKPYGSKHWSVCKEGEVMQKTCLYGVLVDRCRCTADGAWECQGNIESSCPAPAPTPAPSDSAADAVKK